MLQDLQLCGFAAAPSMPRGAFMRCGSVSSPAATMRRHTLLCPPATSLAPETPRSGHLAAGRTTAQAEQDPTGEEQQQADKGGEILQPARRTYILKPNSGSQGRGISLLQNQVHGSSMPFRCTQRTSPCAYQVCNQWHVQMIQPCQERIAVYAGWYAAFAQTSLQCVLALRNCDMRVCAHAHIRGGGAGDRPVQFSVNTSVSKNSAYTYDIRRIR